MKWKTRLFLLLWAGCLLPYEASAANTRPIALPQDVTGSEDGVWAGIVLEGLDAETPVADLKYVVSTRPANGKVVLNGNAATYTPNANFYGSDSFQFKVKDGIAASAPATVSLTVNPVNDAPIAQDGAAALDEDVAQGATITLAATDVDGLLLTYLIKTPPAHGVLASVSSDGKKITYKPDANFAGNDSFTFTASDGEWASNVATVKLTVKPLNDKPEALPQSITVPSVGESPITLQGRDNDNDALRYVQVAPQASGTVKKPEGFGSVAGVNQIKYTPKAGVMTDTIWFKVKDAVSTSVAAAPVTITVELVPNDAPIADAGADMTVSEGTSVTLTGRGSDADGDTLGYSWLQGTTVKATAANYIFTAPSVTADQTFTYTLEVSDGKGGIATDTVDVTVKNFAFNDANLLKCFSSTPSDATLKALTTFTCDGSGTSINIDLSTADLSQLAQLPNLRTLDLSHTKLTNISGLAGLTQLTSLDLHFNTISNLAPLEGMTELRKLDLGFNEVIDISKLGRMDKLQELYLDANQITTLGSVFADKPALVKLSLDDNQIIDLTGLNNTVSNLTHVGLGYNKISDVTALAGKSLQVLALDGNNLTGVAGIDNLPELQKLYLRGNLLTDVNTLSGLVTLQVLELGFNEIGSTSPLGSLANLTRLGLEYNNLANVSTLSGLTKLKDLDLEHNQLVSTNGIPSMAALNGLLRLEHNSLLDDDLTAVAAMSNSYSLRLDDNCLGSFPFPTRIKVYGEDWQFPAARCGGTAPVAIGKSSEIYKNTATTIRLDATDPNGDPLTYTLESITTTGGTLKNMNGSTATVGNLTGNEVQFVPTNGYLGSGGSFTFSATDSNTEKSQIVTVNIRVIDPVLAECFGASIPSDTDLQAMTRVDSCAGKSLTDISALPFYFPNLQVLFLGGNTITDYSPLQNLPKLTGLSLKGNNLDASALAILDGLTGMRILELDECQLDNADLASLSGLTNLTDLYLNTNSITDIGSLSDLTGLVSLKLASNSIDDLTPLSGMSHLSNLVLNNNRVGEKQASNMNILSGLGNLTYFEFEKNGITDVSALTSLSKLQVLSLRNNRLMTADAFKSIPQTQSLALYVAGNCLGSAALSGWPAHVTLDTAGVQRTAVSGACPAPP